MPLVVVPPLEGLLSFEAFRAAMSTAPLDELHQTYDSDGGECDLEDDYDSEDSDFEADLDDSSIIDDKDARSEVTTNATSVSSQNSSMDVEAADMEDTSSPYTYFDPRFDIDRRNLTPTHSQSRHINPGLQSMIDETEVFLEQLSLKFQPIIEEQPMSTTIILANQAVEQVLTPYRKHGCQARLSESSMKFLSGGDTVRRPGRDGLDGSKDGKLRFVECGMGSGMRVGAEKLKRKADETVTVGNGRGDGIEKEHLRSKTLKRSDRTSSIVSASSSALAPTGPSPFASTSTPSSGPRPTSRPMLPEPNTERGTKSSCSNAFGERVGYGFQLASVIPLDGPRAQADSLSFRKTSGPVDMDAMTESPAQSQASDTSSTTDLSLYTQSSESLILKPRFLSTPSLSLNITKNITGRTPFTPLAASFSNIAIKPTFPSPTPSPTPNPLRQNLHTYSCTIDPLANAALAHEAYTPLSMKFLWPATTRVGNGTKACMPTPGLLDALNNILHLYNAEARNLLSYYVHKYETPAELGGPPPRGGTGTGTGTNNDTGTHVEPPHALFRLGICQYLHSKIGRIIDTQETDELGLTPEARRILGAAWDRHPSTYAHFDDETLDTSDPSIQDSNASTGKNLHASIRGLNPLEKTLLARACNVGVETVDAYWDGMKEQTKAWGAMKVWCEGRSKLKIERVKREGRW